MADIPGKGKGLVATRAIKAGEQILVEKPVFILSQRQCTEAAVAAAVAKLSPPDRVVFYSLALAGVHEHLGPHYGRFMTNSIEADGQGGLFLVGSRFNNSCAPNVSRRWDAGIGEVRFVAGVDIAPGDELEITYGPLYEPRDERQQILRDMYGVDCECRACSLSGDAQLDSDRRRTSIRTVQQRISTPGAMMKPDNFVALVKEGLALLLEEGLFTGASALAYEGVQAAAAWSDIEATRAWAVKALKLQELEGGVESSDYKMVKKVERNPKLHQSWGGYRTPRAVPRP